MIVQFDALNNEGCNIYLFHKPISNIILWVLICKCSHYNVFLICFLGFCALNLNITREISRHTYDNWILRQMIDATWSIYLLHNSRSIQRTHAPSECNKKIQLKHYRPNEWFTFFLNCYSLSLANSWPNKYIYKFC